MIPTVIYQCCGWSGPADACGPLENARERVQPGEAMPAGECPECNAPAMLDDRSEPRIAIVATPAPEQATHFGVRTTAQALAEVVSTAAGTDSCRCGFRVAVYRRSPYRQMIPDGYLRIEPA